MKNVFRRALQFNISIVVPQLQFHGVGIVYHQFHSQLFSDIGEGARLPYGHLLLNTPPFCAVPARDSRLLAPVVPSILPFVYLEGAADGRCLEPREETTKKRGASGNR